MVETLSRFLLDRRVKRLAALAFFVTALVLLRHLATLLAFYLIFSRGLGFLADRLSLWTKLSYKIWVGLLVLVLLGMVGGLGFAEVHKLIPGLAHLPENAQGAVQDRLQQVKDTDLYRMLEDQQVDLEKYGEKIQHFAQGLLSGLEVTGRILLHLLLGLILAILYLLERKEVDEGLGSIGPDTFAGYLVSYFAFLAEAVVLTIKVQLVVAAVNALVTLPVLLALGLPHVPALMLMVFVLGLVPVVGNFISGAVLIILAYLKKGLLGIGVFVVSTFVLHKLESYYLNPRLTAKHVKLPSFALIASLIIWEHLVGLTGVFLSFPALFVAMKIRALYRERDTALVAAISAPAIPIAPVPAPAPVEKPASPPVAAPAEKAAT